jgi:hypothetical protein
MDLRIGCWARLWIFQPLPTGLIPLMGVFLSFPLCRQHGSPACPRRINRR